MELKDIVSISGKSGLYLIIGRRTNGLIVESMDEKKKRMPTSVTQKVSVLDDISMYTLDGEERLANIFLEIEKQTAKDLSMPDKSASKEDLYAFLGKVLKGADAERIYPSDIKKLIHWYAILKDLTDIKKLCTVKEEEKTDKAAAKKTTTATTKKKAQTKSTPKATGAKGANLATSVKASGRGK